ncbi:hypothetical protein AAG570_005029 [Ranatra chinensis]|uniref:C2H2-type domain-containing protein n=1 Tax=Ranatra chinensis TaxID=642074 RepID=A0ABD0XZA6_9HEMI
MDDYAEEEHESDQPTEQFEEDSSRLQEIEHVIRAIRSSAMEVATNLIYDGSNAAAANLNYFKLEEFGALELRYLEKRALRFDHTSLLTKPPERELSRSPSPDPFEAPPPKEEEVKDPKPYVCVHCGYRTGQRSKLKTHARTHSNEKPYACPKCDYRASLRYTLKKHMVTHTKERPHACSLCDYKASHKYTLRKHMFTHTGEKPFPCPQCDYRASLRYALKKHMMTHAENTSVEASSSS